MADLASTRIFGKLTVMHEAILKANAEIVGNVTAAKFIGDGSQLTALPWGQLTGVPSTFAPSSHTHPWGEVTGKPTTATRWPAWSEVTGKPVQATRWPSWSEVSSKPSTYAPSSHTHPLSQITGAGNLASLSTNASTSNFLRGDGTWATPPNTNTTYSEISTAEIDAGTASTSRTISGRRMKYALDKKADTSTQVIAGDGLSGGGNLTSNRTLTVDSSVVRTSRSITAGTGLSGGGNLTANRTLSVDSSVARLGTNSSQVRTNSQNDSRFPQMANIGWGTTSLPSVTDANDAMDSGVYLAINTENMPFSNYGILVNMSRGSYVSQLAMRQNTAGNDLLYVRAGPPGGMSEWQEVQHSGNLSDSLAQLLGSEAFEFAQNQTFQAEQGGTISLGRAGWGTTDAQIRFRSSRLSFALDQEKYATDGWEWRPHEGGSDGITAMHLSPDGDLTTPGRVEAGSGIYIGTASGASSVGYGLYQFDGEIRFAVDGGRSLDITPDGTHIRGTLSTTGPAEIRSRLTFSSTSTSTASLTENGLYRHSSGDIRFAVDGSEHTHLKATGDVYIQSGSLEVSSGLRISNTGSAASTGNGFYFADGEIRSALGGSRAFDITPGGVTIRGEISGSNVVSTSNIQNSAVGSSQLASNQRMTGSNVGSAYAGVLQGVGTLIFAKYSGGLGTVGFNHTVPASELDPSDAEGNTWAFGLSGIWTCQGAAFTQSGNQTTLWKRTE